ncbi:bile acid:sodium symporter family protein [Sphingomonas bacterium]|uniref:bile acid:sodium symporter family protein n=1 Tax=Sphingomonas bacterium TaxID=1895847 RepID=UPI001575789A|nr:bile acid:sodium symporter family protein [Sphingomonas bacterium]
MARLFSVVEPFILLLLGTVALATLLPPRGAWATGLAYAADAGIVLLFFLHGAKLSREAIVAGALGWRLHAAVLAATFALFPLLGLLVSRAASGPVAAGLMFLTLLPSTVQSSIAFTSVARGNVAAAVCSASFSNLAGIVVTPVLATLLMRSATGSGGGFPLGSAEAIVGQLLAPFVAGHLLRPLVGGFVARRKGLVSAVDRGSILLVVYTAFGAAVAQGLWHRVSGGDLALVMALCAALLAAVLLATWGAGRALGFERADRVVLVFCGSKKSLASGVPMAGVLFPAAQLGQVILPLMIFHQIQLIACAVIARRWSERAARAA